MSIDHVLVCKHCKVKYKGFICNFRIRESQYEGVCKFLNQHSFCSDYKVPYIADLHEDCIACNSFNIDDETRRKMKCECPIRFADCNEYEK